MMVDQRCADLLMRMDIPISGAVRTQRGEHTTSLRERNHLSRAGCVQARIMEAFGVR